ncbi:elongation of very long chain fatty acids protein 2-like [Corticium candelabrum]|uniref:elongation of very long chain fatty acids protein 2-like n=1 Tax=Corticium candelabrum TaxID=121492 RepID=UPI002E258914|nr:elongation of very long chain fatty acids protein 2-like [Corticium candelabrum]
MCMFDKYVYVSLESGDPRLSRAFFIYWMSKNIELLDTFLMVLRHSFRQLTFLHVFHHSTMALLSDYAYHYSPWPAVAFPLGMNSVVHVVLYSYYGFSAWRPQNLPAWRRHITELQILQFVIGLIQAYFGYKYHGFCIYGQFYAVTMIILFGNFYIRAYVLKKPKKEEKVHVS